MADYDPWNPDHQLAHGHELDPECFPYLGTVSAASIYNFVPVPAERPTPSLVYAEVPRATSQRERLDFAIVMWNFLWESAWLRREMLTDQRKDFPLSLQWLFDQEAPERPLHGGSLWYGEVEAQKIMERLVAVADSSGRLQAILDTFQAHRLEEDFSTLWSWEREDFERRLYRKRGKVKITFVQLDDTLPVIGPDTDLRENLLWSDLFALLDPKQRAIAVCLRSGLNQADIASRIGYVNHSAVSKALRRIRAKARYLLDNR